MTPFIVARYFVPVTLPAPVSEDHVKLHQLNCVDRMADDARAGPQMRERRLDESDGQVEAA
jgi:hypothetical protein